MFEGFVPDPARYATFNPRVQLNRVEIDGIDLMGRDYDPCINASRVNASSSAQTVCNISRSRFATCGRASSNLMAELAGLRLRDRWADWQRAPYTGSGAHVSIYERYGFHR